MIKVTKNRIHATGEDANKLFNALASRDASPKRPQAAGTGLEEFFALKEERDSAYRKLREEGNRVFTKGRRLYYKRGRMSEALAEVVWADGDYLKVRNLTTSKERRIGAEFVTRLA